MEMVGMTDPKPKCRVNWNKPYRAGTICNYVDEQTNECRQTDKARCPCGGIVRVPVFSESERSTEVISALLSENARVGAELKRSQDMLRLVSGEHDAAIQKDERERILDLVDDAISEKSWEIDTHSDDGFQRIVYCSEVDKIIGSFRTPDFKEENKPGCFGAIGLPGKRNDPGCPCAWQERCRQSQEDC